MVLAEIRLEEKQTPAVEVKKEEKQEEKRPDQEVFEEIRKDRGADTRFGGLKKIL